MNASSERLRPAREKDSALILAWRNYPTAYRRYFQARPVDGREHARWFSARLRDCRCRLFIIEPARGGSASARPLGQLRLERGPGGDAQVSLSVYARGRGRGTATAALRAAARAARRWGVKRLRARTLPDNPASTIAFLKAGYRFVRVERRKGSESYLLEQGVL